MCGSISKVEAVYKNDILTDVLGLFDVIKQTKAALINLKQLK